MKDVTKNEIKKIVIVFAGTQNREIEITKEKYMPLSEVSEEIYNKILKPITDEEWVELISSIPMGKACGPTNIAYEDILKNLIHY
ncbi:unnamed protein product [Rhizophagus irregularis]|nr:unnamed protein product [Rhizophagus irregularis]